MKLEEYARYDGLGLAELVARREVTPRELGALALAGIEKVNPRLNAVIETFPERLQKLAVPVWPLRRRAAAGEGFPYRERREKRDGQPALRRLCPRAGQRADASPAPRRLRQSGPHGLVGARPRRFDPVPAVGHHAQSLGSQPIHGRLDRRGCGGVRGRDRAHRPGRRRRRLDPQSRPPSAAWWA